MKVSNENIESYTKSVFRKKYMAPLRESEENRMLAHLVMTVEVWLGTLKWIRERAYRVMALPIAWKSPAEKAVVTLL